MEKKELTPKQIWENIEAAIKEYEENVLAMSDKELYDHVCGSDYDDDDFATKELRKRGIKPFSKL